MPENNSEPISSSLLDKRLETKNRFKERANQSLQKHRANQSSVVQTIVRAVDSANRANARASITVEEVEKDNEIARVAMLKQKSLIYEARESRTEGEIQVDRSKDNKRKKSKKDFDYLKELERLYCVNREGAIFGKPMILSKSFCISPACYNSKRADATAIMQYFGCPGLLLTYTCSTDWPEFKKVLGQFQTLETFNVDVENLEQIKVVGRIYEAPKKNKELFALRVLLINVPGPLSFEYLKTFEGVLYETFNEARKLLGTQESFIKIMDEAMKYQLPKSLRVLFVVLLSFYTEGIDALHIYDHIKKFISHDYLIRLHQEKNNGNVDGFNPHVIEEDVKAYAMALHDIDLMLPEANIKYEETGLPPYDQSVISSFNIFELDNYKNEGLELYNNLDSLIRSISLITRSQESSSSKAHH
uniref:Helitron_like_N domain-containing protein n=1 Tax=Rhabditophanes sp. KR3021 TaxID=114890 RepID=A0AC35UCA9_9BILA